MPMRCPTTDALHRVSIDPIEKQRSMGEN